MAKKMPAASREELGYAKTVVVPRWEACITYRLKKTADGQTVFGHVLLGFDELSELHDAVEQGFSFFTIEAIDISMNPEHMPGYRPTVDDTYRE